MTKLFAACSRRSRPIRVLLVSIPMLLALVMVPTGVVSAHTSFEQSTPADGDTVTTPVEDITLQFSGLSEPAGDGFTVLASDGQLRTPTTVVTNDQKTFELTFDPPLAGGTIGVRWSVRAPDAHPIDGAFSFIVTAPIAALDATQDVGAMADDASLEATAAAGSGALLSDQSASDLASTALTLDDFLAVDTARDGEGTARLGRLIELATLTLLIGGAAFAATTLRGRRAEIDRAVAVLRILGVALVAGALLEYVGVARIAEASIVDYWSSRPGFATLLRGLGGAAIAFGLVAVTAPVRALHPPHSLSAASNATLEFEREERARFWPDDPDEIPVEAPVTQSTDSPVIRRWVLDRSSTLAYFGAIIALVSFWFDGHTVSKGIRPLHAVVNTVHVIAGSVWLGGVVAMAVVLWTRHRSGIAPRALEMVLRFSGIATFALGAVLGAGGLMAFLVLDSIGALFSTQWGQILMLKSAAVGMAMLGGAYNHFRLLPELEANPDDPRLVAHLRSSVTSEAILLGFVIVVTASLVAAASS